MDYLDRVLGFLDSYESLGVRVLDNGTKLIGHVPHVAPEAWLHVVYPPLNDLDVERVEDEIQMELPASLRDFLKRTNGLHVFSSHLYVLGLRRNYARTGDAAWQPWSIVSKNREERPGRAKPSHLFVGGYQPDGSLLYLDCNDLRVFRCSGRSVKPLHEWPSFEVMLEEETRRLATRFDERGRLTDPETPTTP